MTAQPDSLGARFENGLHNNFHALRLLAALLVIYGHAYAIGSYAGADIYLTYVGNKFIGGVSVDVFFVVSGFLVAGSFERSSLRSFIAARFLRIYPALVVCMLVTVLILGPLETSCAAAGYWSSDTWRYFWRNATLAGTEYFLPGVFEAARDKAVNGSLWSLPLEVRLYVAVFLLGISGLLVRRVYAVLAVSTLTVLYFAAPSLAVYAQYGNWFHSSGFFAAGTFCWLFRHEIRLNAIGVLVMVIFLGALHGTPKFYIAYYCGLVYLVFYVALALPAPQLIRQIDLSYGVYLYGWPVQQLLVRHWPEAGVRSHVLIAMGGALGLAFLSWTFVEKPALNLKKRFFRK